MWKRKESVWDQSEVMTFDPFNSGVLCRTVTHASNRFILLCSDSGSQAPTRGSEVRLISRGQRESLTGPASSSYSRTSNKHTRVLQGLPVKLLLYLKQAMLLQASRGIGLEVPKEPLADPSRLDDWFLGRAPPAPPRSPPVPFFPEVHEELTKTWAARGYVAVPQVERAVAVHLCPRGAATWRDCSHLPSRTCKLSSALAGRAYHAAGQAATALHAMATLQVYQAQALKHLHKSGSDQGVMEELRAATDFALRAMKVTARSLGQGGLFGDTVEAQQFSTVQKQTEAIKHILTHRKATIPPPGPPPTPARRRVSPPIQPVVRPCLSTGQSASRTGVQAHRSLYGCLHHGKHVLVRTDSTAIVAYINRQGGLRSRCMPQLARLLLASLWGPPTGPQGIGKVPLQCPSADTCISRMLNVPVSTVGAIIRKWKEHQFPVRGVQRIIRRVPQEPRTTSGRLCISRILLQQDYGFLTDINVWHPFVTIGVYSSTLSAAMSNLIGASRILYALARDDLFGRFLSPAKHTSASGNPWVSVLISWILVQLVLFSGKLNTIASIVTIFFLLVYAAVDLACLALEWASAPNFRPTFRYFTWHTCVLGIIGCAIMMFLINAIYASASIAFMLLLLLLIHYLSPVSGWGCISQALIFHQVRKYLLMLDVRKDHVKFWRPQVLLMVSNPRSSVGLIKFINDIKKSGLYVLGHVQLGDLDVLPSDPLQSQYDSWLSLVDHLNIKAFVNLTLADSIRHGVQHLLFISGLGGMRPNTLVLGFYDDTPPQDQLQDSTLTIYNFSDNNSQTNDPEDQTDPPFHFPPVREGVSVGRGGKSLGPQEYVCIIADAVKMLKNVALARYFGQFDRTNALQGPIFVDVWPVNLLRPDSAAYVDTCSLFLLQLACILNMTRTWQKAKLRLFLCVEEGRSLKGTEQKLKNLLKDLRMKAEIYTVPWDSQVALHWQRQTGSEIIEELENEDGGVEADKVFSNSFPSNTSRVSDEYLQSVNKLILDQPLRPPAVRFLYLPRPPADTSRYHDYIHQLELLTRNLGPTLLIHGVTPVITTDL
ncbi:solute carrier family 12 member 9-like [Garra rufa]